jgi:hypothetical protein
MRALYIVLFFLILYFDGNTQTQWKGKFEQLGEILPTPNSYRTGSGAPGIKLLAATR